MSLSEQIRIDSRAAIDADPADLGPTLRAALSFLAKWPIGISPGAVSDGANTVGPFDVVIHTLKGDRDQPSPETIAADNCAAIIDAAPKLDIEVLRRCHARIAAAKLLNKTPAPHVGDVPVNTSTLGVVYAQSSELPFEVLAGELERLNASVTLDGWVDALVVGSTGIFSYAVQFPGDTKLQGASLPPGRGRPPFPPSIFIVPVIRQGGADAINRLAVLLAGQLAFFSPGYRSASFEEILGKEETKLFLRRGAYSFTLSGELRPTSENQLNAHFLPRRAFHIVQGSKILGAVDLLGWQDGGVVTLRGQLPLEMILSFLEPLKEGQLRVTHRPGDLQLSQVLPLNPPQFLALLSRFQQRSNMRVNIVEPNVEQRLVSNEGTTSPYMARLFLGLLHLRSSAIQDEREIGEFDAIFNGLRNAIADLRESASALEDAWSALQKKVANGEGVQMVGTALRVEHLHDRDLNRHCSDFLRAAVNVIKVSLQQLAKSLGADIGFWFNKEKAFLEGVAAMEAHDPDLASYLTAARGSWSEQLVNLRIAVEHHSWRLPNAGYRHTDGRFEAVAPEIEGEAVLAFVNRQLDRACCAVEEIMAHLLAKRFPRGLALHEIPLKDRDKGAPTRFEPTLTTGGKPIWRIQHHNSRFLDC